MSGDFVTQKRSVHIDEALIIGKKIMRKKLFSPDLDDDSNFNNDIVNQP